jgi:dienelactone hydrolase
MHWRDQTRRNQRKLRCLETAGIEMLARGTEIVSLIGILFAFLIGPVEAGEAGTIAGERVEFDSAEFTYLPSAFRLKRAKKMGIEITPEVEPAIRLIGYLKQPKSHKKHPAIVLMHACAGITEHEQVWEKTLVDWGFAVLTVDSLTPRGRDNICHGERGLVGKNLRALDAHGAARYLAELPTIDAKRIGVLGLQHGGMAALYASRKSTIAGVGGRSFAAAVAYYPLCDAPEPVEVPTLILHGELDMWTPLSLCREYVENLPEPGLTRLEVFPGAYHFFDHPDIDTVEHGQLFRSDPVAAAKSRRLVRSFLDKQLREYDAE